jgi:hypothetical protein
MGALAVAAISECGGRALAIVGEKAVEEITERM